MWRRPHRHRSLAMGCSASTPTRPPRRRCGTARVSGQRWSSTSGPRVGEPTMAEVTYLEGIRQALFEEMERDANVFCMGEDIGAYGGAFKVTDGLLDRF